MSEISSLMSPIAVALIAAIIGPWILEYWKWKNEPKRKILHEKEVRYFTLLTNFEGFIGKSDSKKVAEFYEHYRTVWLYAPDEVIFAINKFFNAVGAQNTELIDTDIIAGNMVWEMRKDFYGDTTLTAEDFLIISPKEG